MKLIKAFTFFTSLYLLLSANCNSQANLKSAKNAVKSKVKTETESTTTTTTTTTQKTKVTTMATDNPCDTNGTVQVTEGNKAFTSYKNCLKQLEVAERKISNNENAETTIKMLKRNMASVLKKEPDADLSEVCSRLRQLEGKAENGAADEAYFKEIEYIL